MAQMTLYLKEGGYLEISGHDVAYLDGSGKRGHLTPAQQTILAMLARDVGKTISYEALYEGYSGMKDTGVNQEVAKIVTRMPKEVKACVRCTTRRGYRLDPSQFDTKAPNTFKQQINKKEIFQDPDHVSSGDNWTHKLIGDYYGFFLDSVGDGAVLGIYLSISAQDREPYPEIVAKGVLGIQSDHVFLSDDLRAIFSREQEHCYEQYADLKSHFSVNDQRCFYGEGKVSARGTVAAIMLRTASGSDWTILMDMDKYLDVRRHQKGSDYPYRGGMGLIIALTGAHGKFCCRCALVRKEFMRSAIKLSNPDIRDMLKISDDINWSPLELDVRLDREWYNWFMKDQK